MIKDPRRQCTYRLPYPITLGNLENATAKAIEKAKRVGAPDNAEVRLEGLRDLVVTWTVRQ